MLLWMDGFDQYTTQAGVDIKAMLGSAGYTNMGTFGGAASSNVTRTGIGMSAAIGYLNMFYRSFASVSALFTGQAMMFTGGGFVAQLAFEQDNFLGSIFRLMMIHRNANGGLTAVFYDKWGNTKFSYHSAENVVFANCWHYYEVQFTPSWTSGTLIVKVDGIAVITVSGAPTCDPTIAPAVNMIGHPYMPANNGTDYIDDWYILKNDGVGLSSFLGDVVVHAVLPVSDAGPNQMTQFGGTLGHFSSLRDINAADDASYVYTAESGMQEMFTLDQVPIDIIDVLAVQVGVRARKDSAGISNFHIMATSGTTTVEGGDVGTTTQYLTKFLNLEAPPGGGAWTLAKAQSLVIGFKTV